jgi:diazepam-binding inhibitor (GABA receptor modulator, acyl-CoA-binding protein)
MSELQTQFETAAARAKNLTSRPDNDTMLQLYSLYKQATEGNVSGKRPGFTDFVGRAKHDAWTKNKGTKPESAMQSYIDLVNKLSDSGGSAGFGD